jgi:hypothetical protein
MIHCFNCGTDLPENVIYCLQCGRLVDDGEFDTRVRPAREKPKDTVVVVPMSSTRTASAPIPPPAPKRSKAPWIALATIGALAVLGIVVVAAVVITYNVMKSSEPPIAAKRAITTPAATSTPSTSPPTATPAPKRVPTATPQQQKSRAEELLTGDGETANSAVRNAVNRAAPYANTANTAATGGFATYQNGKRIRAICRDGGPSYWQGDASFTCAVRGGVHQWFW